MAPEVMHQRSDDDCVMKDENAESRHDDEHARDPGCDDAQEVPPREAKQSTSLGATPTPPSHPPPMDLAPAEVRRTKAGRAKTKRVKNTIHMAGFVLSEDQIGRLCVEAWDVSQEMLENAGPFDCAYMYLGSRTNLNSPDFIEFWYKDPKTKRPTEAWMLPCRLAFVQPGATVPTLSFDAEAEAYIDHWFPPHIRASAAFESVKYAQVEYKGSCDCVFTLRSH